jgi:C4-dicarboxylate transporter, DctM subunit
VLTVTIIAIVALVIVGIPLGFSIVGGVMLGFALNEPSQLQALPGTILDSVNQPTLVALPLFIIAGAVIADSGLVEPIVSVVSWALQRVPGGAALTAVLTGLFFAGSTGSTAGESATIARALYPALLRRGYDPGFTGAVIAASASLGVLFPPSITLIVYATLIQYPVEKLWLAGLVPGLVTTGLLAVVVLLVGRKQERPQKTQFEPREVLKALPAVAMPVLVVGGIYSGTLTVSETAAALLAYVIVYCLLFRRRTARQILGSFVHGGELAGMIFLVISAAHVLTYCFLLNNTVNDVLGWVTRTHVSRYLLLALINVALLGLGTVMDGLSTLIVGVPLVYPVLLQLGLSPVEAGIMLAVNIEIGVVHPPIGMNLWAVSGVTGVPVARIAWRMVPFIVVLLLMLAGVTYLPLAGVSWPQ